METLSRAKIKLFSSLQQKKYRDRHRMFLLEGIKLYEEALQSGWPIEAVIISEGQAAPAVLDTTRSPVYITLPGEFKRMSSQISPEGLLTVVHMPEHFQRSIQDESLPEGPGILIAGIQDPGNLGTIMRTADWLGVNRLVLGPGTVDVWNPKTLRATMGAIFRLEIMQVEQWYSFLKQQTARIWLADMDGVSLEDVVMGPHDWLMVGNEANGIPQEIGGIARLHKVTIPRQGGGESLNVAVATAILAWKLRNP